MQNKIIFTLLILIAVIFVTGSSLFLNQKTDTDAPLSVFDKKLQIEIKNDLVIPEQSVRGATTTVQDDRLTNEDTKPALYTGIKKPGVVLVMDVVKMVKSGYVVIYEDTFEPTGKFIGVSAFLNAGQYMKMPIGLTRGVVNGESFTAILHEDNGDGVFNIEDDVMYRNEEGQSVFTKVFIQNLLP